MQKEYTEVIISFEPFSDELIAGFLDMLEVEGMVQEENFTVAYFHNYDSGKRTALFNFLENMKGESLIQTFTISEKKVPHINWNEEWEKTLQPIKVTDNIVIKPSFRDYSGKQEELIITIDPKMSFGTGYHETTRLMIRLLKEYIKKGDRILDAGTGTGVLAIVAVKLGAAYALAFDNDEVCEENVLENIEKNRVEDKVSHFTGEAKDVKEKDFDIILANIQRNILIDIAEELKARIKPGGVILLSGLLQEDEQIILEKYLPLGFKHLKTINENEWRGIAVRKLINNY